MATIKKGLVAEMASRVNLKLFLVIFGLIWRPVQTATVANFNSKFYFKCYTFIKVMNIIGWSSQILVVASYFHHMKSERHKMSTLLLEI